MRRLFTSIAVCLGLLSASAQGSYTLKTLTFEDNDYVADTPNYLGQSDWSSLIDNPQYGGDLLYGENHGDPTQEYSDVNYRWYDKGNTWLYSELPLNWGTHMYWGGGHAVSNYWDGNLQNGDYLHQLSVYVPNNTSNGRGGHGHNGSDNFCVHYGYRDDSGYSAENLPWFKFGNGGEYVIDGMWVNNTTYFVNCVANGNDLTAALGANEYVMLEATGYKNDGSATNTITKLIAHGSGLLITEWEHWDMSKMDAVNRVEFNVVGNTDNGYGFSLPAYFCYDDVQVRIPESNDGNNQSTKIQTRAAEDEETKMLCVRTEYVANSTSGFFVDASESIGAVPDGCEVVDYTTTNGGVSSGLLPNKGDEYSFTITGMPQNATITKIEGSVCQNFGSGTKSTITVNIGDKEIVHFNYGSWSLNDDEFPNFMWGQSPQEVEIPLLENVDTKCTDDIKIGQICVDGKDAECRSYYIYYTLDATSGISGITNGKIASDAIYTLQGIRVNNPVKGQIYIKNGKKFIMK